MGFVKNNLARCEDVECLQVHTIVTQKVKQHKLGRIVIRRRGAQQVQSPCAFLASEEAQFFNTPSIHSKPIPRRRLLDHFARTPQLKPKGECAQSFQTFVCRRNASLGVLRSCIRRQQRMWRRLRRALLGCSSHKATRARPELRQFRQMRWERRPETLRRLAYTLLIGEPSTREQMASRATLILAKEPRMCTRASAMIMRVRVAFSMANLHLPSLPARRPMARARWSPLSILTSVTMKLSTKRSSTRSSATAKPSMYALQKSAAFCKWSMSCVCDDVLISTH